MSKLLLQRLPCATTAVKTSALVGAAVILAGLAMPASTAAAATAPVKITSRSSLTLGESLRLTGTVAPSQPGSRVTLQRYYSGKWHRVMRSTLTKHSQYAFTTKPGTVGVRKYRVYKPATSRSRAAASATRTVKVYPRAVINWSFLSASVDAGAKPQINYATSQLPATYAVVLQRQIGTAATWKPVAALGRSGTSLAPAVALGRYAYRAAVIAPTKAYVTTTTHFLTAFGAVPFSALCAGDFYCHAGTYTTSTLTFNYATAPDDVAGSGHPAYSITTNTCRALHIDWIPGSLLGLGYKYPGQVGVLSLVQESLDPASASTPMDSLSTLDSALVPGQSWSLNLDQTGGTNGMSFYMNGSASCYTSSGR